MGGCLTLHLATKILFQPLTIHSEFCPILVILKLSMTVWRYLKNGKRAKGSLESKKRGKQSYSAKYRVLTPRRHYPRLGVVEQQESSYLIQHPTPGRDAQRLGVDETTRKWSLHQDLNA
ncbi:hypothetical protein PIB30_080114 [Stylosanthes scabra]|uniref:Uncharacterized protein n=1 Tax=Stylosanthes scabra TaxID=79078 RepID=A0ABU6XQX6_9FABA|nr:hypothetical protein [Stylosanthes scabra]